MITGRNIICFSNDWRNDPTSKHQIMRVLGRENTILWINSVGLRQPTLVKEDVSRMARKLRSFFRGPEKIHDRFYVFTPIVIPFHHSKLAQGVNTTLLTLSLEHYIKKFHMKDIIFWFYLPSAQFILRRMHPAFILYHCVDEWSKFSFIDEKISEKEESLCRRADIVLTSARELQATKSRFNPHTYYIPHGVDYEYFHGAASRNAPAPPEMAAIPKPIAGFFGLIHEWIDTELLEYLVRRNPAVSFVFIGKTSVDVSKIAAYPNAHFLGQKAYGELVSYAQHFDVGLIPFKINELTINVNPIKLKEYLALGVPVVSVDLPEVAAYERVVNVAGSYEAFDEALRRELRGECKASRAELDAIAREETWERKVEEISALIEERTNAQRARPPEASLP